MNSTADEVNIRFGATIDDFKSKMAEVQGIFGQVAQRWVALAAVVAGGAAFKEFVAHANAVNVEAEKMSRTLGITTAEAGTIAVAIDDVGQEMGIAGASAETYTSSFLKFNRMLRTGSDELKAMGVNVDALKSGQMTSNEVFMQAVQIVGKYKPGIDQTQASMKLFGRSVEDVQLLMGLTKEKMDAARKSQQELNLTITAEGVAAAKAYRVAMDGVGDVLDGFKKTVGEAVMPMLTQMADQIASFGPTLIEGTQAAVETVVSIWNSLRDAVSAVWGVIRQVLSDFSGAIADAFGDNAIGPMEIFKNALRLVAAAFVAFRIGVETVANIIRTIIDQMKFSFANFGEVAGAALRLDWEGVKSAWRKGHADSARVLQEGIDRAVQIAQKGREDLDKALVGGPAPKTPAGSSAGTGTQTFKIKDPKAEAEAAARAAAQLALERATAEASLSLEKEYLAEAQAIYDDAFKNNLITTEQYFDAKLAVELRGIDASLEARRKEADAAAKAKKDAENLAAGAAKPEDRNKFDAQALKFKADEVKLLGEINVLEAQRIEAARKMGEASKEAARKLADDLNSIRTDREKAAADNEIETARKVLEQKVQLREIDAETAFEAQKALEQRSYEATLAALEAKRAAVRGSDAEILKAKAELDAEKEAAEAQHQQRMTSIDQAAELERKKYSLQAQQSVQGSFQTMVADLLNGVTKVSDVFRKFAQSVANTFVNLIAQKFTDKLFNAAGVGKAIDSMVTFLTQGIASMVGQWLGFETAKTVASEAGAGTRMATDEAAAAVSIATQKAEGIAAVLSYASIAAVAAMASVAAIPFYGWAMAPAVGAETYATGLAYLATAKGGWDEVPEDQIAQLHRKEMVLSAPLAEGIRAMVGERGVTPMATAVDQILSRLAPDRIRPGPPQVDGAGSPANQVGEAQVAGAPERTPTRDPGGFPVPADASTSLVPRQAEPAAPVAAAAPLPTAARALAPEARPVAADAAAPTIAAAPARGETALPTAPPAATPAPVRADAATSLATAMPPAPEGQAGQAPRRADGPLSPDAPEPATDAAPAPRRPNAPGGPAFAAVPVPADESTSLVLAGPARGDTAKPPPARAFDVAAAGKPTTPAPERETAKSLAAAELPTRVGLQAPEIPQPATPASTPQSDVGKLVIRWMGEEQNKPLAEGREALSKFQSVAAGQPTFGQWRVPSNPLGRIQASAGSGESPQVQAQDRGKTGNTIINLNLSAINGHDAKRFLLDNSRTIADAMSMQARNHYKPHS